MKRKGEDLSEEKTVLSLGQRRCIPKLAKVNNTARTGTSSRFSDGSEASDEKGLAGIEEH